jgi:hypothetical protein
MGSVFVSGRRLLRSINPVPGNAKAHPEVHTKFHRLSDHKTRVVESDLLVGRSRRRKVMGWWLFQRLQAHYHNL